MPPDIQPVDGGARICLNPKPLFLISDLGGEVVEDSAAYRPGRALRKGFCFIDGETEVQTGQGKGLVLDEILCKMWICLERDSNFCLCLKFITKYKNRDW